MAVDWNVWKDIGKEFMVKSNINDWIVCQPIDGSMVTNGSGSIVCQNVKNVATTCSGVVPYRVLWHARGVCHFTSVYYYLRAKWFELSLLLRMQYAHVELGPVA